MKTRTLSLGMLACGLGVIGGCATPPENDHDHDGDEEPYAYRTGVPREAVASAGIEDLGVDWSGVSAFVAQNDANGSVALTALEKLLSATITADLSIDPTKPVDVIAAAIAGRISEKACPTAVVTYKAASPALGVELGAACALAGSGMAPSGTVLYGVTAGQSPSPWTAVEVNFFDVGLDGYGVNGRATLWSDGTRKTLDTRLELKDLGTVTFRGDVKSDGVTIDFEGRGTWSGATVSVVSNENGWHCVSSLQRSLDAKRLKATGSECYAKLGTVEVITPFICTREREGAAPERRTILSTSLLSFLPTTPQTGIATVGMKVLGAKGLNGGAIATPLLQTACMKEKP